MVDVLNRELREECARVFSYFDTRSRGVLPHTAVRQVLRIFGVEISEDQVAERVRLMQKVAPRETTPRETKRTVTRRQPTATTLRTAATRRSGGKKGETVVSFQEFVVLLTETLSDCERDEELRETFESLDADKDGHLGINDMKTACMVEENEAMEMIKYSDIDGDGKVTFDDFQNLVSSR